MVVSGNVSHMPRFLKSMPMPGWPSDDRIYTNRPLPHPRSTNDCNSLLLLVCLSWRHNKSRYVAIATSSYTNFAASVFSGHRYKETNSLQFKLYELKLLWLSTLTMSRPYFSFSSLYSSLYSSKSIKPNDSTRLVSVPAIKFSFWKLWLHLIIRGNKHLSTQLLFGVAITLIHSVSATMVSRVCRIAYGVSAEEQWFCVIANPMNVVVAAGSSVLINNAVSNDYKIFLKFKLTKNDHFVAGSKQVQIFC